MAKYAHNNQIPNISSQCRTSICSNSRLSEFRINLFIDNFSSFHLSNNISSHFLRERAVSCRFVVSFRFGSVRISSVYPECLFSFSIQLHFSSSVCFGIDTLEWIFIVELSHYVFWLQIFCAQLCKNWHRLTEQICDIHSSSSVELSFLVKRK